MSAPALHLVDDQDADLFDSRPVLQHIRDFARARRTGPWAVLSVVLVRAACAVEPSIMLPPLIGGRQSLNLFTTLVGASGTGKGAADGCAEAAVRFTTYDGKDIVTDTHPIGSGEGISRIYRPHGTDEDEENPVTRAMFSVPEIDSLAALGSRQGATLMPELRKMYGGEPLGFSNASKLSAPKVSAHSYRAGLVVGVQPLRAGALLNDADGGTPQRFIWAEVTDADAPNVTPTAPPQKVVRLCKWETTDTELEVPDNARRAIDAHRLAVLRGHDVDPLDGHALLCRLKVAAALMVLDGQSVIREDDWTLAGDIMRHSASTRSAVAETMREQRRRANQHRGIEAGERQAIADDVLSKKHYAATRRNILKVLATGQSVRHSDMRRRMEHRDVFDVVILDLIDEGVVVSAQDGRATTYRAA